MSACYRGTQDQYPAYHSHPTQSTGIIQVAQERRATATLPSRREARLTPPHGTPLPSRGPRVSRPSSGGTRTPLLLRGTIGVALFAAVAASLMRAKTDMLDSAGAMSLGQPAAAQTALQPATSRPARTPAGVAQSRAGQPAAGQQLSDGQQATTGQQAGAAQPTTGATSGAGVQIAPDAGCRVGYAIIAQATNRFSVTVTVQNTGTEPVNGWALRWAFPAGQQISYGWNATFSSDGTTATATDAGFDRQISPGSRVTFGFIVGPDRPVPPATGFALNGVTCT